MVNYDAWGYSRLLRELNRRDFWKQRGHPNKEALKHMLRRDDAGLPQLPFVAGNAAPSGGEVATNAAGASTAQQGGDDDEDEEDQSDSSEDAEVEDGEEQYNVPKPRGSQDLRGMKAGTNVGYTSDERFVLHEASTDTLIISFDTLEETQGWFDGFSRERVDVLKTAQNVTIMQPVYYNHDCPTSRGFSSKAQEVPGAFTFHLADRNYTVEWQLERVNGCQCAVEKLKNDAENWSPEIDQLRSTIMTGLQARKQNRLVMLQGENPKITV